MGTGDTRGVKQNSEMESVMQESLYYKFRGRGWRWQKDSPWPEAVPISLQRSEGTEQAVSTGLHHHRAVSPEAKMEQNKKVLVSVQV